MKRHTLLLCGALVATLASPAFAQTTPNTVLEPPSPRQGYYASLGIEAGAGFLWDKGDSRDPTALTGVPILRLGQLLTQRFSMGLRLDFTGGKKGDETTALGGLLIETGFRVWNKLAVQGGFGAGYASVSQKNPPDPDDKLRGAYGALYMLGLSYDFFPYKKAFSGGFAITPTLGARFLPGSPIDAVSVLLGVDFVWWTGLPKNQLDLPPDRAF
ncbi:MAG: hypothetical protein SF187_25185 [Deltaproteobacteria bacterium]|nr:hypothetical protein [Deltaproteobacteria bacterium]